MIKIKNDFNLNDTITCGQIFRFEVIDNGYILILDDRVVRLEIDNDFINIYSSNEENICSIIKSYLGLNINYNEINNSLMKNDIKLKEIINYCNGFKIINSPKFETIISYMISSNNTVKNIQKSVNLMSEKYGKKIYFEGKNYFLFPNLEDLKKLDIEDFKNLKLGFRSKYIYDFINNIKEEDITYIDSLNTEKALNYLMKYKGIGIKVASCILLFAFKRFDVFPIDTWVKKYMKENYNLNSIKEIEDYTKNKYGNYSGIVIQYIYHSSRNKK